MKSLALLAVLGSWGTAVVMALLVMTGCAMTSPMIVAPPPTMPTPAAPEAVPVVDVDGGFTYTGGSLFSRRRARQVGDLVTIQVVHNTKADTKATTSLKRDGTVEAGVTALMGLETALANIPGGGPSLTLGTSTKNDYDGEGGTNRTNAVSGTLTTRVIEVMPTGNLRVYGTQNVRINNETEVLAVTGVVDPRSITASNSVPSTAVAELQIEYAGVGVVSGKQRPGWFTRVLDVVTPF